MLGKLHGIYEFTEGYVRKMRGGQNLSSLVYKYFPTESLKGKTNGIFSVVTHNICN